MIKYETKTMKSGVTQIDSNNKINNGNNDDCTIELEPFIHQVGGRSTILVLGKYICKPINERELLFYHSIDQYASELKSFIPGYNGTISVNFEESKDGYLVITTKSTLQQSPNSSESNQNSTNGKNKALSSHSPYQKFVTKYRIKLVRPIREIIIESHEHDVDSETIDLDLESANRQLKKYIVNDSSNSNLHTNLNRSRSTSISIPNFEDGNFNQSDLSSLFDNQFFINEVGQNGTREHRLPADSVPVAATSPNSPKLFYNMSTTKHNPWVLKTFSVLSEFNESMKEQSKIIYNW